MKWVRAFPIRADFSAALFEAPSPPFLSTIPKGRWQALQRQNRLGSNRQFSYVYRRGKKASCKEMSLLYVRSKHKQVGFSVSKKVGVAVVRNRTKRRLRECVRPLLAEMKGGLYVFVARPSAAESSFQELNARVKQLLRKVDALQIPREGKEHP